MLLDKENLTSLNVSSLLLLHPLSAQSPILLTSMFTGTICAELLIQSFCSSSYIQDPTHLGDHLAVILNLSCTVLCENAVFFFQGVSVSLLRASHPYSIVTL